MLTMEKDLEVCLQREEDQPLGIGFRKLPTPPHCQVVILRDGSAAKLSQKVSTISLPPS